MVIVQNEKIKMIFAQNKKFQFLLMITIRVKLGISYKGKNMR